MNFSFVHLDAGFEEFKKNGVALPEKTVETLKKECDGALFGAVRYVYLWRSNTLQADSLEALLRRPLKAIRRPSSLSVSVSTSTRTSAPSNP